VVVGLWLYDCEVVVVGSCGCGRVIVGLWSSNREVVVV